jgi:hypothetical protein
LENRCIACCTFDAPSRATMTLVVSAPTIARGELATETQRILSCCLTFEFTRGQQTAKPGVERRVQRRVSPWPDNTFFANLSASMHARTLPEAMVQAQLPLGLTMSGTGNRRIARATFTRQGARSAWAVARPYTRRSSRPRILCISGCGLTFEFTRVRKRAKPAVALRVQRRVRRHGLIVRSERPEFKCE